MKKTIAFVLMLTLLLTLLSACDNKSGNTEKKPKDSFYTQGFTKGECNVEALSKDLVCSILGSMGAFSSKNTLITNASIQSEMAVDLNGIKFDFIFKINYHPNNANSVNTLMMEINDPQTGKTEIGFYYITNNGEYEVYIKLNDNKISLGFGGDSFIFPMDMSLFELLEGTFAKILTPIDGIKYEYKNSSGGTIRHFYTRISLKNTLQSFISLSEKFSYSLSDFEFLFKSLLGVSIKDIKNGTLPESTIELEFTTKDGASDKFGEGVMSQMDIKLDVERSSNLNTVFKGQAYFANFKLKSFDVKRELLKDIVKLGDLTDFVSYKTTSFSIKLDYSYPFNDTPYELLLDFFYDPDNISDTKFAYRIVNKFTNLNTMSVYLKDSMLYINVLKGSKELNAAADLDFELLLNGIFEFFDKNNSVDFTDVMIYLLGAITINSIHSIDFKFELAQFALITGLSGDEIITLLDNASQSDLIKILEDASIDLKGILSTTAVLGLPLDSYFITSKPSFEFPDNLNRLN